MNRQQENILIKNFLSESEYAELKAAIDSVRNATDEVQKSRARIEKTQSREVADFDIPASVAKKFEETALKYGRADLKKAHHTFFEYAGRYKGETIVAPHTDKSASQFSMDYQFDANVEWSLFVEGTEYVLGNNDLLIFSGSEQIHWRPRRNLSEEEYCGMVIFHYAEPEHWIFSEIDEWGQPQGKNPMTYEQLQNRWAGDAGMEKYLRMYGNDHRYIDTINKDSEWFIDYERNKAEQPVKSI